jgi:acetate kinase
MILIVDAAGGEYSLFDDLDLRVVRAGQSTSTLSIPNVSKCGVLVNQLSKSGLLKLTQDMPPINDRERIVVEDLRRKFKDLWLISDTAFFKNLPPEATIFNPSGLKHGLIHASVFEEASKALGHPDQRMNLVSCYLDNESSVAAVKDGVATDLNTDLPSSSNFDQFTGLGDNLVDVVSKPKLRSNPKFKLAFKSYLHQVRLSVGAFASVLGGLDGVVLSGTVAEKYPGLSDSLAQSLPGLGQVTFIRIAAQPYHYAAELLRSL